MKRITIEVDAYKYHELGQKAQIRAAFLTKNIWDNYLYDKDGNILVRLPQEKNGQKRSNSNTNH